MKIAYDTRLPIDWYTRLAGEDLLPLTERSEDGWSEAEVLMCSFYLKVTQELIARMPRLRIVVQYGVGYDNIDVAYCSSRGIWVTNTPQPVIEPTAELALTMMLALSRRVSELDRGVRGLTVTGAEPVRFGLMENLGYTLYGKTLGIVGLGNIGKALARRAVACGMKVIYHNRHRVEDEAQYQAHWVEKETLLREADVVSLNLPYSPEVHHWVGEAELRTMKPTALLVNTARGKHIDEVALVRALQQRWIAGAALDVHEQEPQINEELKKTDNCLLLPHVGTATWECRKEMALAMEENILAWQQGKLDKMTIVNQR